MRILIVGRHKKIVKGATMIATAFGHSVHGVCSIDEQRKAVLENTYHLILVNCAVNVRDRTELLPDNRVEDFVGVDSLFEYFEKYEETM
ncbi:MAG: hypothetical protein H7X70_01065 [Candidatus Kapabacteria bacterium]|nr:hypothetical protein [Candidatus Kapabacteria bacterium]